MRPLFIVILVLATVSANAQTWASDVVKEADEKLNQLIVDHRSAEASSYYSENFQLITSSGKVKRKQDLLNEIGNPELSFEINVTENVEVVVEGKTAILTGRLHQKGRYKGKEFDNYLLVTDTWVQSENGWKILAGHATLLPKT